MNLNINSHPDRQNINTKHHAEESPITPAVTGIVFPYSPPTTDPSPTQQNPRRSSTPHHDRSFSSSNSNSESPPPPADLDHLWTTLRQEKQRKMAKEQPKVKSFEDVDLPSVQDLALLEQQQQQQPSSSSVMLPPSGGGTIQQRLTRHKSITSFRESPDGRVIAIFDMRGVDKRDIHVSFQRHKLVITWETYEAGEWEDEDSGCVVRERLERVFHRTLPLPEGTRFEEIEAVMNGKNLVLRYPNMRCIKVEYRSAGSQS